MRIGEVAERVGIRTSTIRYYEELGLLPPPERRGGRRRYGPEAVEALLFVRFCQRAGFSLAEVRELLGSPGGVAAKDRWRGLVDEKLAEVDALIEQAEAVRELLEESRDCECLTLDGCRFVREERATAGVEPSRRAAPGLAQAAARRS